MGLSLSLFLGCQNFMDQTGNGDGGAILPSEEMALSLAVKEENSCAQLHEQVAAARVTGSELPDVEDQIARQCINELPPLDKDIRIPSDRVPDGKIRCRWIRVQIENGRGELVVKFRYHCPDSCARIEIRDPDTHRRLCVDPVSDCAELRKKLSTLRPDSEEYARLKALIAQKCGDRPDPVEDTCLQIRRKLSTLDPNSAEYARLRHLYAEKCMDPVFSCEEMRRRLASLDPSSPEYARLKALIAEKCVDHPPTCEEMRAKLATLDPASEEYARLKAVIDEKCVDRPPTCEEMRAKLATLDPNSQEYAELRFQIISQCGG
jgi:predicted metal-binding transcription factor (methanogenesis marker protein 9)